MDVRLKRLRFRSAHRGTKEIDLILGAFAERRLDSLDAGQLDRYEALIDSQDPNLYEWIAGLAPPPPEHDTDVLRMIREFGRGAVAS
ncbi:MAG: succinate dehydrogenase assembly factor 2 [Alphaproteobacteria bacterium]|nr:succinate dehydrogenase assembly factor 2 [Alphaproteobacteria bacterium]